jgi:Arc/MetJ-type ribon-helix-helix transcriptional regulator
MSKGTPMTHVRLDLDLVDQIQSSVGRLRTWSPLRYWTLSEWIRQACQEKLSKMERSRRPRRRRASAKEDQPA